MCETGDSLDRRLSRHFSALHDARGANRVVFALEHGLETAEVATLRAVVEAGSQSVHERSRHPLLWVVHATEVAYDYEGDEYWQSFATRTPGWDDHLRHWIRELFRDFARQYGGPMPTGPWAATFGIIAWPITNAILPTDLQRYLARALYQARSGLAARLGDIGELGRYVASAGGEGSDRYNQLRQQPNLLGQIALALLRPEQSTDELLLRTTLRRVAADLEDQRAARAHLREAQRAVDQTTIQLSGPHHTSGARATVSLADKVASVAKATAPRILLRPDRSKPGHWGVWLQLPDLSPLAAVDPVVADALRTSRCWAPASDRPVATGQLLRSEQELPLARWPSPGSALLHFQGMAAGLESALLSEWAAPSLPALFGVQNDGHATHILSRAARAGRRYLVAHERPLTNLAELRADATCTGVTLYALALPPEVSRTLAAQLREFGIMLTRSSRVWPALVVPTNWDGEAAAEWLTGDTPILGILPDHDLRRLQLDLGNGITSSSMNVPAGTRLFAIMPRLPVGTHRLTIHEEPTVGAAAVREISIGIRDPHDHSLGEAGPVRMWVEPYSRNLATLWDGTVVVCATGPAGAMDVTLSLAERPRSVPEVVFRTRVTVPMGPSSWRAVMDEIRADENVARRYDEARWGVVQVGAQRFGTCSLEFERSIPALRWRYRDGTDGGLFLVDETASATEPAVVSSSYARPGLCSPIRFEGSGHAIAPEPHGGLYVARLGEVVAAVIVPPSLGRIRSLEQLRVDPEVAAITDERSASLVADQMGLWATTPLPGNPVARVWRSRAVRRLHHQLMAWICGPRWIEAEDRVLRSGSGDEWLALRASLRTPSGMALVDALEIVDAAEQAVEWPTARRIESIKTLARHASQLAGRTRPRIVARHGAATHEWVGELWLRLATDPGFASWSRDETRTALMFAVEWPLPIRTARCLALRTIVNATREPVDFPPLLDSWTWQ